MKYFLLSTAVALVLTIGGYTYEASAADNGSGAPDGASADALATAQPPGPGQWGQGRGSWGGPGWWPSGRGHGRPGFGRPGDGKFSLFAPVANKNLTDADVKIIASALLLEHGNHSWGVSNIASEPDKSIQFSYITQHGDVIATFAIDPASGRIKRVS